jgi:hypothetical protein
MAVKSAVAVKPVKSMNPRSGDTVQMGSEPDWTAQPAESLRKSALTRAFVWYNYFYGKKEAKDCVVDWLARQDRLGEAKRYARIPDSAVSMTIGWVCRANVRGLELSESELDRVNHHIADNLASQTSVQQVVETVTQPDVTRPNIQDRLRERMIEAAGEIEGMFDEFVVEGSKLTASVKPLSLLRSMNVAPQMVSVIKDIWNRRIEEFNEVLTGKDAQLAEGYGHLGKVQIRNCVKFAELVISDCDSYVQIKKADHKPRAKKAASPEKVSARFKFLREFDELKLKSEPAARLVGATEAWLYDTKKRKLIHVLADQHMGTFTVKGSSIVGYDTVNSMQKTLRKPAEQLKSIAGAGKPAARKYFKEIKSTEVKFNGRGNENLIILRVW